MLNLKKQLEKLEELGRVVNNSIELTEIELSKINTSDSKIVQGFLRDLKDMPNDMDSIKNLQDKINKYASNR